MSKSRIADLDIVIEELRAELVYLLQYDDGGYVWPEKAIKELVKRFQHDHGLPRGFDVEKLQAEITRESEAGYDRSA